MTNKEAINELAEMGNMLQIIPSTRKGQALKMAIKALNAEFIRPKGEWLLVGHDDTCNFYRCSFCGYEEHDNFTKHHNFCPNCGADMKGE